MDVLIYARVSHDSSGRGRSVEEQEDAAKEWAKREGWHVAQIVRETGSASRYARSGRKQWEEVMQAIKEESVDAVLTWEASRATRDLAVYAELRDACAASNVLWGYSGVLHDLRERDARFRTGLDALLAEDEAARTSERVRRSTRANAEKGRPHGKQIYGYERIYDEKSRDLLCVEEHPEEGPVVKEAARRVLAGESFYSVAKEFNSRGIPPRRASFKVQRRNLGWTPSAIKQMLSMPAYAAKRQHRGEIIGDADWPQLIDPAEWGKLQRQMSPPERKRTNDWTARHLLAGIAVCGVCGAGTRVGKQNARRRRDKDGNQLPKPRDEHGKELPHPHYHVYECKGAPGRTGFHIGMKEEHLDTIVTEFVLARLERPDFLAGLRPQDQGVGVLRQALNDEIARLQEYLEQVRAEAAERQRMDLLFDQEDRVKPKIEALQRRLDLLAGTDPVVLDLARSGAVREAWEGLGIVDKRRIIRALVTPLINRVGEDSRGRRGLNWERVDMVWR